MTNKKKTLIENKTKFVKWLVESAITDVLLEQAELPVQQQPPVQAAPAAPAPMPDPNAPPAPEQPPAEQPPAQVMSLDEMIERLNVIRGGRSFTDPEVYTKLGETYKSFTDQQKAEFGSALSKIVDVIINPDETQDGAEQQQQPMSGTGMPPADAAPSPQAAAPAAPVV